METATKLKKRQELGARSRTAILDAALQLMSESGYDGAVLVRPDGVVAWRSESRVAYPSSALSDLISAVLSSK